MTMEFLIVALFAVSLLTNLTVEGIKKLLDKKSVDSVSYTHLTLPTNSRV